MATDFEKLTVTQLRQELKRRKLATTGLKAALVARLVEDEAGQTAEVDEAAENGTPAEEPAADNDATPEAETEKSDDVAMDDAPVEDTTPAAPAEKAASSAPQAPSSAPEPANSDTPKAEPEAAPDSADANKNGDISMDDAPVAAPEKATSSASPPPAKDDMPEAAPEAASELDTTKHIETTDEPEIANRQDPIPPVSEIIRAEPSAVTEVVQDIVSRKRRSRSPPPSGDESSNKRARQDDREKKTGLEEPRNQPASSPADKHLGELTPFETVPPRSPETRARENSPPHKRHERTWGQRLEGNQPRYQEQNMDIDTPLDEFGRIERSRHPATSALYIKNFMRPLKENQVRDYIVQIAAFPGAPPNDECIHDFHVDQIRTHALVKFDSVSAASRVRTALHGKVWPNESNRKELWVDFIPSEKVAEWIRIERDSHRQTRWEVIYEEDSDTQEVMASLVQSSGADTGNSNNRPARQPLGPQAVATGPGRRFPGLQDFPSGPRVRGRGQAKHDLENFENVRVTTTGPPLRYQPVSEELVQRRIENMRSYYTQDRYRDMGREDEINRYTFENRSQFVDRGKEVFIGIRHPIREARKRRERNELRRGGGRWTPSPPPFRRQQDRSYRVRDDRAGGGGNWSRDRFEDLEREDDRGRRVGDGGFDDDNVSMIHPDRRISMERTDDRRWDKGGDDGVPRSRFDGAPLPTYTGPPRNNRRRGGRNRR